MGFLIYGYAHIASSTMPNNFLKVAYEPSGLQMLYFVVVLPVFVVCAIFIILIGKLCNKWGSGSNGTVNLLKP